MDLHSLQLRELDGCLDRHIDRTEVLQQRGRVLEALTHVHLAIALCLLETEAIEEQAVLLLRRLVEGVALSLPELETGGLDLEVWAHRQRGIDVMWVHGLPRGSQG